LATSLIFIGEYSHEKTPHSKRHSSKIHQRRANKTKAREQKQASQLAIKAQKDKQTELIYQMRQSMSHHFPQLFEQMREVEDMRTGASEYDIAAILTGCIAMSLFKTESRNGYNQAREDLQFKANYRILFGFDMPHGDTVHRVIEQLDESQLEQLKQTLMHTLLTNKVFHKSRYRKKWFRVAIDGSGVVSFPYQHCEQCCHKTLKTSKTTYFHTVLDARLITPNGFSISLACEWIENPKEGEYDKQDCERKAFARLALKLKKAFPRLPIIILADGLYPYAGFFKICEANGWAYCLTFKQGNLPSVWEEVEALIPLQPENQYQETRHYPNKDYDKTTQIYRWVDAIDYCGYTLHWLVCEETHIPSDIIKASDPDAIEKTKLFVHITNLPLNRDNVADASRTGRLRWKIENEGFNTLKNGGYGMQHKWARKSYQALKNYYQCMQIGHLINQLMVNTIRFHEDYLSGKNHPTLQSLWTDIMAAMKWAKLKLSHLQKILNTRIQCRFVT
ncbi:hypothetical protein, partial [Candidatus Venteria ishoeyi]|uniref:hypothetical protein n=1 Tax=Candidatus Venteria ishoeyi TaxID=1899563 RepID=UPI0015AAEA90